MDLPKSLFFRFHTHTNRDRLALDSALILIAVTPLSFEALPIGRKAPEPTGLEHTTEQSYRLEDVALLEDLHGALAALHQLRDLFTPET